MMTKLVSGATNIWGERLGQICPQHHVVKNFNDFIDCLQTSCLIDSTLRKRRRLVGSGKTCSNIKSQNGSKFEFQKTQNVVYLLQTTFLRSDQFFFRLFSFWINLLNLLKRSKHLKAQLGVTTWDLRWMKKNVCHEKWSLLVSLSVMCYPPPWMTKNVCHEKGSLPVCKNI